MWSQNKTDGDAWKIYKSLKNHWDTIKSHVRE